VRLPARGCEPRKGELTALGTVAKGALREVMLTASCRLRVCAAAMEESCRERIVCVGAGRTNTRVTRFRRRTLTATTNLQTSRKRR
jgi:hypothetical protein